MTYPNDFLKMEQEHAVNVLEQSLQARNESNLCKVLHFALPILKIISAAWFLPKKIRLIIGDVVAVAEAVCPTPETALIVKEEQPTV